MMTDEFLAKPDGETIVHHTKELITRYEQLKKYYPGIPVNWDLLYAACIYHDLGKIIPYFQEKMQDILKNGKVTRRNYKREIPHGVLSTAFLPFEQLESQHKVENIEATTYAVATHHVRDISQEDSELFESEIESLKLAAKDFPFSELGIFQPNIDVPDGKYYRLGEKLRSSDNSYQEFVMQKGLLNRIDYAASGDYEIEYKPDFLNRNMPKLLEKWQKDSKEAADWNDMQKYTQANQDESLVIIGQTGSGKTEAGLLWIGDCKGFFILPLRTAINAMYDRVRTGIADEDHYDQQVGILHSDSLSVLSTDKYQSIDPDQLESYLTETRGWSLPLTITTLDQTFDFVYHYSNFERKLATFAYSKVVIDEIQMYSPTLLAYLIKGLKEIQDFGGKFLVMTATLPPYILDLFEKRGLKWKKNNQPFLNEKYLQRHHLQIVEDRLSANAIAEIYQSGKLLVICNTVRKAKDIYDQLSTLISEDISINLLHSQFIRKHRQEKEEAILEFAKTREENKSKEDRKSGIWIATQVVEASLDIDFDLLITELSELNGLLQRMGRCYRKRNLEDQDQPNVYVFDGGAGRTSGISSDERAVVQHEIFEISKEVLRENGSGLLTENDKLELINKAYTTDRMRQTEYYDEIDDTLELLLATQDDEISKGEVQNIFRNIQSRDIIPKDVYLTYKYEIDKILILLSSKDREFKVNNDTLYDAKQTKRFKRQLRSELRDYMMSIPEWLYVQCSRKKQVQVMKINDYERVFVVDGDYKKERGFEVLKGDEEYRIT